MKLKAVLAIALVSLASQAAPRTVPLWDGSSATLDSGGFGLRSNARGWTRPFTTVAPQGRSPLGDDWSPSDIEVQRRAALAARGPFAPRVLVGFAQDPGVKAGAAKTGNAPVDAALRRAGVKSLRPLHQGGAWAMYLAETNRDARSAARELRDAPGVMYAEPDWTVSSMAISPRPFPARAGARATPKPVSGPLPSNVAVQQMLSSFLDANGVNAVAAYAELTGRYGELPGHGTLITNVSVGDLTDQAMVDAGDFYVQQYGPTTIVQDGQRYLDFPSLPLIPTYTVAADGSVDPLGTVEHVDPYLGEVLLDFSVMAPLPHELQRPGREGSGPSDLLGIAPGAQYRLVVPQEPTMSNILTAMLAAAQQVPRPDVITASLGMGFDTYGYPGRYLEDDPYAQSVIAKIVNQYGVVVCISSNDGTRLFTNAAVNPDGGSAPTNLATPGGAVTSASDDAFSTIPSAVQDSGAIAVGGTTLDDISSAPPSWSGPLARTGQFPATRLNGSQGFSSGFGTRVNLAAPSDNIPSLMHLCAIWWRGCSPSDSTVVLNGGTSASAPMVAAAAAIAIQAARLAHRPLTPRGVRDLLVRTGRPVTQAPQLTAQVGTQLDVTNLLETILGPAPQPTIARLAIAHRQPVGSLGAIFITLTDPSNIDLLGPSDAGGFASGQNLTGPITFAPDILDAPRGQATYVLRIGSAELTQDQRVFRLLPAEILSLAGLPVASDGPRDVPVRYEIRRGGVVVASTQATLTFGPSDGMYEESLPPAVPGVVQAGEDVLVHYDLTSVRGLDHPALVVSSIGHWSPASAPFFRVAASFPLEALSGTVRVPASTFAAGAGVYGVGIMTNTPQQWMGEFAAVRVAARGGRPEAPLLADASGNFGHAVGLSRASHAFSVRWDVRSVPGADGAALEVSAPGPTIYSLYGTFTNQFGDRRDANGMESPSVLWYTLPSAAGTKALDALALGLPTSLFFNLRVFATRGGKVVGEASPSVSLELDDSFTPGGAFLTTFDVTAGAQPLASMFTVSPSFDLTSSSVVPFDVLTGEWGAPLTQSSDGLFYSVIGSDPGLQRALTMQSSVWDWMTPQTFVSWDLRTGTPAASVDLPMWQGFVEGARVDPVRHRAAILALDGNDYSDALFSIDLTTGGWLTDPVRADGQSGLSGVFRSLDIDTSTGKVVLGPVTWSEQCFVADAFYGAVDLDHGTSIDPVPGPTCGTSMVSDGAGSVWMPIGPPWTFPSTFPPGAAQAVNEATLDAGARFDLGGAGPLFSAIDPQHKLLVVGFMSDLEYRTDNNAMSEVGVYDLRTGRQLSLSRSFNFIGIVFGIGGMDPTSRGIQLDPATRTGWTYGPGNTQLQQFSY